MENHLFLKIKEDVFKNISDEIICDYITIIGGEIGKTLYMYKNKIINYLLDEVQCNTLININDFILEHNNNINKAYEEATKQIMNTIVINRITDYLFEELSDDEADEMMEFIYSQDGDLQF